MNDLYAIWYDWNEGTWNVNLGVDAPVPDFEGTMEECLDYIKGVYNV